MINRRNFIRNSALTAASISLLKTKAIASFAEQKGLKDYYKGDFHIGVAINGGTLKPENQELQDIVKREFDSITAENEFKWAVINPKNDEWRFDVPDQFVKFGLDNNLYMLGHCLVWHSQVPRDLFVDEYGNQLSKEALLKKMEKHITTLVDRYKGKIDAWDVVNEALTPEDGWRKTKWIEIIGSEFMERAFHLAHDADPMVHLIYNDYNMDNPKRRQLVVDVVKDYKKRGVPIHGIGLQGHWYLDSPSIKDIEDSIAAFANEGMKIHITELDIDVLPYDWGRTAEISTNKEYSESLNPYKDGLPKEINDKLTKRYEELFKLFLKYKDSMERVTFWGISDDLSWKNNFPMRGRTNYPMLFDRQHKPKDAYWAVVGLKK